MAIATKKRRWNTDNRRKSLAPKRWRPILLAIPGYDCFRDAEGCWFDAEKADYYVDFIETCCTHIEGPLAGMPMKLEIWEKAIVGNLFGWYRTDSAGRATRRYTKVLIYVPRKNGKTPLAASIHNAIFFVDEEAGQINNIAAASRDQASKLYRHIHGQIRNEPLMEQRCTAYATTRCLTKPDESVTKVIPADENVAHGDNPYFQAIDELHAQPSPKLYNTLTSAMVSNNRSWQLLLMLTTADFDRPSVCNDEYAYACKVRDGVVCDPNYLPVIYEAYHKGKDGLPEEDDWTDERTWAKANPNLGVSVSLDALRTECRRAKEDPAKQDEFKRLHLNIRTKRAQHVISLELWDKCGSPIDWDKFAGQRCWGGLDIGATSDFVAFTLLFPAGAGETIKTEVEGLRGEMIKNEFTRFDWFLRSWFWLPERMPKRDPRMEAQIEAWSKQGFILRTPGNVADYTQIARDIGTFVKPFGMVKLAIDQGFQGMQITQDLQGIFGETRIVAFRQGILSMAAPCREIIELILQQRLHHDGNPVLRWMASNVAAETRGGLMKFSKDESPEKIDGMTAAAMAIGTAMAEPSPKRSVYETRGVRTV